ncbi:MAG TPA: hypothetical protein VEY07_01140 [Thermoplasmata archaeon]|nr:hypothetical protein [Thermoplasmata archaeon]
MVGDAAPPGAYPPGPEDGSAILRRLPDELVRFLRLPRPVSLLVRGAPGTGRSLLARAILEAIDGHCLVLTDEASEGTRNLARAAPASWQAAPGRSLFENGAAGFGPDGRLRLGPPDSTTSDRWTGLVVDTWDSLVDSASGQRRRGSMSGPDSERSLFAHLARSADRLVAVAGIGRTTSIEYLVDGIIETVQTHEDDRTERWLRFVKLRDVELAGSSYPFTLTGGRFRAFPIYPTAPASQSYFRLDPDPDPSARGLWPGSADYARLFGRLVRGTLTLLECDRRSSVDVQLSLVSALVFSGVVNGGRVVFVPPPTLFPDEIWAQAQSFIPPELMARLAPQLREKVRILSHVPPETTDPAFRSVLFPLHHSDPGPGILSTVQETNREFGSGPSADSPLPRFPGLAAFAHESPDGRPNLELLFIGGLVAAARELESGYTPEALAAIIQRDLNATPLHVFVVAWEEEPLVRELYGLATTHLRLVSRHGRYFVQGLRPWTENRVLLPPDESRKDSSPFELVPLS